MTNTKEFNEAVERLVSIINQKRAFVPKFDDYEPKIQESLRDTIKTILDALGIEIVSRENGGMVYCDLDSPEIDSKPKVYVENIKGAV